MNVLGGLESLAKLAGTAERRGRSDELVHEIAEALATSGEYLNRIDVLPTQQVVDFSWAAHQAARSLGIRVQVEVEVASATSDGQPRVRVRPQLAPA